MRTRRTLTTLLAGLLVLLLALNIRLAQAEELNYILGSINALNSGYAITRWPYTDGDVFMGHEATVRAITTEYPEATRVWFRWIRPDGTDWLDGPKDLNPSVDTWDGNPVRDASSTKTLDMMGAWGVQAYFEGANGKPKGPYRIPSVQIKAISWHVVPEVPLGTVAVTLSMLGGLSVFAIRKKAFSTKK